MKQKVKRNYFDLKVFILVGFIPALALILSYSGLVSLIIDAVFKSSETINELYYYFFSRTDIWSLWLGIAAGSSIRVKMLLVKKYKHQAVN
jgi:hypothetical protein